MKIESQLEINAWKKINDKVSKNGGLYIYRDNFDFTLRKN
jgi:hypothetical protein